MLVVLSMLVLFMMIGTAFLMSSSQYGRAGKASAKLNRVGNYPTDLMDRGLMQVLRDTNNPQSAVRYHSLLRDMYGVDGFEGIIYAYNEDTDNVDLAATDETVRFAGAMAGTVQQQLGPTEGQLVDLYVKTLVFGRDDSHTSGINEAATIPVPDVRHGLKLERDVNGRPQVQILSQTKGYYNGCLLTITSGPAQGQSGRIVDYQYIRDLSVTGSNVNTRLYRFRVLAFPKADGTPLHVGTYTDPPQRVPELVDLAGARFVVNGRPFNGTGVGYNPMAQTVPGFPRLSAYEALQFPAVSDPVWAETALLPNAEYFFPTDLSPADAIFQGMYYAPAPTPSDNTLNPVNVPVASRPAMWKYPTFAGPGDTDESYDAADFQNMFLALQSVTPRARGRVVHKGSAVGTYDIFNPDDPAVVDSAGNFINTNDFLRLDLEDLPLPSFFRPELFNYWLHRCVLNEEFVVKNITNESDRVRAFLQPYGADAIRGNTDDPAGAATLPIRDQIVALKRMISLRPLREDHPNFDGSNPLSRGTDLTNVTSPLLVGAGATQNVGIPYWEAIGPWDVDNDNDGVPDSVWVDLGDPVQQAEDGTLYKPLYAFLIVDLDSRLNVNAHGLAEHILPPALDPTLGGIGNLANDLGDFTDLSSSNTLPHGIGYGPAEINLRSIFPAPWLNAEGSAVYEGSRQEDFDGDGQQEYPDVERAVDDYAALLAGRVKAGASGGGGRVSLPGRYGFDPYTIDDFGAFRYDAAAGVTNTKTANGRFGAPDIATVFKYFGYPNSLVDYLGATPVPTAFGTPPDLAERYPLGLDFTGQPAYEFATESYDRPLVADAPYELDLSSERRRDMRADRELMIYDANLGVTQYFDEKGTLRNAVPSIVPGLPANDTDDAPFATAELERILRAHDPDAGSVPSRLWDVVAGFDPIKLLQFDPYRVQSTADDLFDPKNRTLDLSDPDDAPKLLTAAQQMADVTRRLVTTDSFDLPVPSQNMPAWVNELGPDGAPGAAPSDSFDGDDNNLNGVDDPTEIGLPNTDDFQAVTGTPYNQATLVDLLLYRSFLDQRTKYIVFNGYTEPLSPVQLGDVNSQVPNFKRNAEVIVRGERFTDNNKNGVWDTGEPWVDAVAQGGNGNGVYDPPLLPLALAPELIAGRRMDINRPFGDGRDNIGDGIDNDNDGFIDGTDLNGDGAIDGPDVDGNGIIDELEELGDPLAHRNNVVDEPSEAGEPFLDLNGNGKWDNGALGPIEPYIDEDGNHEYTRPRDQLWQGLTAEPVAFDYTNGKGEPLHPSVVGGTIPAAANVRNLSSEARQLYARQLYILMMLLVDNDFLETPDVPTLGGTNINNEFLLQAVTAANQHGSVPMNSDKIDTMRRLKARQIAQWAVNCVDFRDADAIMTPFEYDSNPWDGWGCPDSTSPNPVNIPLDGDPATDENLGQVIDWQTMISAGDGVKQIKIVPNVPNATADAAGFAKQTRGVVWGAERPELLITETLAWHDRRCTKDDYIEPPGELNYDLDQKLKPRGSLFVELYNPWSADAQEPAELYDRIPDVDPVLNGLQPSEPGVMLNKLSDVGVSTPTGTKYSPVWRLMVMRDPIGGLLTDQLQQLLQTDPDGYLPPTLDLGGERWVYFTTGDDYRTPANESDTNRANDDNIAADYQGGVPRADNANLKVWVPPVPYVAGSANGPFGFTTAGKRYFIARTDRVIGAPNDKDVAIAPILPGRYAVVGSSGLQLSGPGKSGGSVVTGGTISTRDGGPQGSDIQRFVTPISRLVGTSGAEQDDIPHRQQLDVTRRIELWPDLNPEKQQLLVSENGGPEIVRTGKPAPNDYVNVTDSNLDGIPNLDTTLGDPVIEPCVAIPVEDLNISEPVEGYPSNYYRQRYLDNHPSGPSLNAPAWKLDSQGSGELLFDTPYYDHPLDLEWELVRDGTTQNYRSVHLQRLANPMLPWNPPPFLANGNPNLRHQKNLPVNPYLTIDSMSCDLTAFNGAGVYERYQQPNTDASNDSDLMASGPVSFNEVITQHQFFVPLPVDVYKDAPDHILWGLIYTLKKEGILPQAGPINTPKNLRDQIGSNKQSVVGWLTQLEQKRGGDFASRKDVEQPRGLDKFDRRWDSDWGWSLYRRELPDDPLSSPPTTTFVRDFVQRLNMKSLERGGHYLGLDTTFKWVLDPAWQPRALWQQERPSFLLSNANTKISDLKNVRSRRVARGLNTVPADNISMDDAPRSTFMESNDQLDEQHVMDYVLEQTLGFTNEAYAPEIDRVVAPGVDDKIAMMSNQKPGAPEILNRSTVDMVEQAEVNQWNSSEVGRMTFNAADEEVRRKLLTQSTYPWLAWNDRPFVSQNELLQVPAANSSLMLRQYTTINNTTGNAYNGTIVDDLMGTNTAQRLAIQQAPFGHLLNYFMSSAVPAKATNAGVPELSGAPNYSRILDYVEVPSRYVGTETLLSPNVFNDDPTNVTSDPVDDIRGPGDPRYSLQPPFNKISRERDPGRVNLNTVVGRRTVDFNGWPVIWSEVYDGIMHRYPLLDVDSGTGTERLIGGDSNLIDPTSSSRAIPSPVRTLLQMGHTGPAWRDVALSRRGYAQNNADGTSVDKPYSAFPADSVPDTFTFGLNRNFPSFFSNPFRSPDAGDLVPLPQMVELSAQASWLRSHPYARGDVSNAPYDLLITNPFATVVANPLAGALYVHWGRNDADPDVAQRDDDGDGLVDDIREAGYAHDGLVVNATTGALGTSGIPLFSDTLPAAPLDGQRNPYNMYGPLSRLGNMVTTRSNVYAIWVTVGYFEVEPAPDFVNVQQKFGGDGTATATNPTNNATNFAARALYDRVYPEGYALAQEMGSATGDVRRERAFYIIDRTRPVAFKPGEDLNVDDLILVRRRIE